LSNESNEPVYFDNFTVADTRGRIIEEDHYYAFGLKIAGISSVKFGDPNEGMLDNKNLYNDKELFDDADLDWYDYGFRNYDPQIGRFPQLDPLTDDYPHYTPFQYAGNEPIANVDLDGLEELSALSAIPTGAMAAEKSLAPVVLKVTLKAAPKVASAGASIITKLSLITAKGVSDALLNANTLGLSDAFGNNHLSSYDDPYEQAAYLRGRLGGDAIAAAQGSSEVNGGIGAALTTGIETAGVGAAAGLVVGLHGAGVGATAAYDAAWALKKLYQLNVSASDATSARSIELTRPPDTKAPKYKSLNQLNKDVQTGRAPKGIKRFDKGRGTKDLPEDEATFDDNSSLYRSGKWRHNNGHKITNKQREYLKQNGWTIPK